jgi:hypothetical protein
MGWIATGLGFAVVALLAWGAGERHRRKTAEDRLWVREESDRMARERNGEELVFLKFPQRAGRGA